MVGKRPLELGVGKKITSLRRAFNSGEDIGRVKPKNIQIWNYNKIDKILGLQLYFSRNIYTYCFYDLNNHENVKIRSFIKLSIFQHICYSAPQSAPPQDKKAIKLSFCRRGNAQPSALDAWLVRQKIIRDAGFPRAPSLEGLREIRCSRLLTERRTDGQTLKQKCQDASNKERNKEIKNQKERKKERKKEKKKEKKSLKYDRRFD